MSTNRRVFATLAALVTVVLTGCVQVQQPVASPAPSSSSSSIPTTVTVTQKVVGGNADSNPSSSVPPQPASGDVMPGLDGAWTGEAIQESESSRKMWLVDVVFDYVNGSTIVYKAPDATVKCRGRLLLTSDEYWTERITSGPCDDGGRWFFVLVRTNSIEGDYSPPGGKEYSVKASLSPR